MKKLLLLLCLIAGIITTTFAQLGKMQFEDAEEQYAAGKYKQTLELLDEAPRCSRCSAGHLEHKIKSRFENGLHK